MVKLGSVVKDLVTGYTGVAIGRTEWLFGCTRIGVEPRELHEGKPQEQQWFDEQRILVVEDGSADRWDATPVQAARLGAESPEDVAARVGLAPAKPPGGPQRDPRRSKDPRR